MDIKTAFKKLSPVAVEVQAGKTYTWCGCGKSSLRPFCDNAHDCQLAQEYQANLTETVYFCGCVHTHNPPFCDGSHGKLQWQLLQGDKGC